MQRHGSLTLGTLCLLKLPESCSNPTLETLTDLLRALGVTAEVRLRPSQEGEPPIKVETPGS